jgi:peroxiredoxin
MVDQRFLKSALSIVAFALVALGAGCSKEKEAPQTESQFQLARVELNSLAPDFTLKDHATGVETRLSDFRGKVVLVNFWAPWCPPCREELPDLVQLYAAQKAKGLEILGITVSSESEDVEQMIRQHGLSYRILTGNDAIAQAWHVSGIPTTYIVDRAGIIRNEYVGARPRSVFEQDVVRLLAN